MPDFESGVGGYIHGQVVLDVYFPIDHRGHEYVCCEQCWLYRRNSRICGITNKPTMDPGKYVGEECPLNRIEEAEEK